MLDDITESSKEKLSTVWENLDEWTVKKRFPITFVQLYEGCSEAIDPIHSTRDCFGPLWDRLYHGHATERRRYMPDQVGAMLGQAIMQIGYRSHSQERRKQEAVRHIGELYAQDAVGQIAGLGVYGASL